MTDKTKPRRARRWPYLGPIDTSAVALSTTEYVPIQHGDAAAIADARTSLPRALDALEKVLALHQPEAFHDDPSSSFCARCQRTAGIWPCETVDAIESALGIEAGGDQ